MKKKSRMYLRRKADKLWSELVRKKNNGNCEVCGKTGNQPHHCVGRKNLTLRHDLRNGVLLCFTHHTGGNLSAHNDPIWFLEWFKKNRPDDWKYLSKKRIKLTPHIDYEKIIKKLSEQV